MGEGHLELGIDVPDLEEGLGGIEKSARRKKLGHSADTKYFAANDLQMAFDIELASMDRSRWYFAAGADEPCVGGEYGCCSR